MKTSKMMHPLSWYSLYNFNHILRYLTIIQEPYVEPLRRFPHLRELWIGLRFRKTHRSRYFVWDPEDRVHTKAIVFFAEKLPLLELIAFSMRPASPIDKLGRAKWNPMLICRDSVGRLTKIMRKWDLEHGVFENMLEEINDDTA